MRTWNLPKTSTSLVIIQSNTLQASGNTKRAQQFSPSSSTTLQSNMRHIKTPTISYKPFAPSTPFPRIGKHHCTYASRSNGTTPPGMSTYPCLNMSPKRYTSSKTPFKNPFPTISQNILRISMLSQTTDRRYSIQNPPMTHPHWILLTSI